MEVYLQMAQTISYNHNHTHMMHFEFEKLHLVLALITVNAFHALFTRYSNKTFVSHQS